MLRQRVASRLRQCADGPRHGLVCDLDEPIHDLVEVELLLLVRVDALRERLDTLDDLDIRRGELLLEDGALARLGSARSRRRPPGASGAQGMRPMPWKLQYGIISRSSSRYKRL